MRLMARLIYLTHSDYWACVGPGLVARSCWATGMGDGDARETERDAQIANVLTMDEARHIASNIAKLPGLLKAKDT